MSALRTEYPFQLPKGYVDADGDVHHDGTMRLATARDELEPLGDPKVRDADDPYLSLIVLSRVITRLGPHTRFSARDIEGLFAADLAYLQDVYATINYGTQAELDRFLADRGQPAKAAPVLQAVDQPAAAEGPSSTPISDAARSVVTPSAAAGAVAAPADAAEDTEEDPPRPDPSRAPRRSRIEEVGKSSGRPR